MTIFISPSLRIRDIQQRFSDAFPYLKIEFFSGCTVNNKGVIKDITTNKDLCIINFATSNTRQIIITPRSSAVEVEEFFFNHFSLYVKMFRKSELSWTDISADDKSILQKHNWIGREESGALFDFELL
jgi:hypothetical protein